MNQQGWQGEAGSRAAWIGMHASAEARNRCKTTQLRTTPTGSGFAGTLDRSTCPQAYDLGYRQNEKHLQPSNAGTAGHSQALHLACVSRAEEKAEGAGRRTPVSACALSLPTRLCLWAVYRYKSNSVQRKLGRVASLPACQCGPLFVTGHRTPSVRTMGAPLPCTVLYCP